MLYSIDLSFEKQHKALLEAQGVAALKYVREIEAIIEFIKSNVYLDYQHKTIEFDINDITGLGINVAEKFIIRFIYSPELKDTICLYASDLTKMNIIDGMLTAEEVVFQFFSPGIFSETYEMVLRRFLYHELTHCIEDIKRRKAGRNDINDAYLSIKSRIKYQKLKEIITDASKQGTPTYDIPNIIYRLYIGTEMNASLNELYADLISIRNILKRDNQDINRDNYFDLALYETETGQDYKYFSDLLKDYANNQEFKDDVFLAIDFFNDSFLNRFKNKNNEIDKNKFKKWFLHYGENALNTYFKKICQISETFIINELDNNISLNDITEVTERVIKDTWKSYGLNESKTNKAFDVYSNYIIYYKVKNEYNERKTHIRLNNLKIDYIKSII